MEDSQNLDGRLARILDCRRMSSRSSAEITSMLGGAVRVDREQAEKLGFRFNAASAVPQIWVSDPGKPIGVIDMEFVHPDPFLFFENTNSAESLFATIRVAGQQSQLLFMDAGRDYVGLSVVSLRSEAQCFYWGSGSTAVHCSIEMEGNGRVCVIGDDALISSGVWLRNHDMHSIVDLADHRIINGQTGDILVERHVWMGQDVLALGPQHIGYGSIVGARALLKKPVPPKSAVGGMPAKVLRQNVSWGRSSHDISPVERQLLASLEAEAELNLA
jgi:hypothetical protein